jgi:hypothetical protein
MTTVQLFSPEGKALTEMQPGARPAVGKTILIKGKDGSTTAHVITAIRHESGTWEQDGSNAYCQFVYATTQPVTLPIFDGIDVAVRAKSSLNERREYKS